VRVADVDVVAHPLAARRRIGFVPSGDRTFYLRISGLENLVFFGRLCGLTRRQAIERGRRRLEDVGLLDAAHKRVGLYSHGMEKRLSIARALLLDPPVLLVDEATHDLDPDGVHRVKELVRAAVRRGAAVIWATQRLDEIRGFADSVLLLDQGVTRFEGSVEELVLRSACRRYLVRLRNGSGRPDDSAVAVIQASLRGQASILRVGAEPDSFLLDLAPEAVLSDALARVMSQGIKVLDCTQERSEIEEAFLRLTGNRGS
jgi:ABC-type multidrug transport system ATPase subunit